jgi:hypothetical protein
MTFVIVVGNVADGFRHYGPFDTAEYANEWADSIQSLRNEDWVCVKMYAPDPKEIF